MKLLNSLFWFLCLGSAAVLGAEASMKDQIKEHAELINQAMIAGDSSKIVELTYPALVERIGGRDKMIAAIDKGTKELKAAGFAYVSATTEEPSDAVESKGELYVIVPYELKMHCPGGTLRQKTCLIGISGDQGKSWTFLSGDGNAKLTKELLPNFPATLKIPVKPEPVIEKDKPGTQPSKN
jgi:hypothetical protein